jgi:hypothetical protein
MKLLCLVGIHNWVCNEPEFETQISLDLDIPEVPAKRCCSKCGKEQTLTVLEVNMFNGKTIKTWG